MADEKGIKVHVVKAGEFKGSGAAGTPVTDEILADRQKIINSMNEEFKKGVAIGRGVTIDKVNQWADGRIHTAAMAQEMGLIDGIESIQKVLDEISQSQETKVQMSNTTQQTEAPAATSPAVATIQELEANCPGASADFLMSQLKAGATIPQAQSAMIAEQNKQIEQAKEDQDKAVEAAKEEAKNNASVGVAPLDASSTDDADEPMGDCIQQFETKVAKMVDAGMPRRQAMNKLARTDESLYKQYLVATNKPSQARKLADKFTG